MFWWVISLCIISTHCLFYELPLQAPQNTHQNIKKILYITVRDGVPGVVAVLFSPAEVAGLG